MTRSLLDVKAGDQVGREWGAPDTKGERAVMWLTVTEVTDDRIFCNRWEFDRETGAEIDHELRWGPEYGQSGSFLKFVKPAMAVS